MYCVRKVNEDYTWIGADSRRLAVFEGVFGVPEGVSYNSYLLMDEKTVLFDTVDAQGDPAVQGKPAAHAKRADAGLYRGTPYGARSHRRAGGPGAAFPREVQILCTAMQDHDRPVLRPTPMMTASMCVRRGIPSAQDGIPCSS